MLAPGAYTAIVAGKDDLTGVGLVEVYRFHNLIARADVNSAQFRREGGDDFLKARIAADRVPSRRSFGSPYWKISRPAYAPSCHVGEIFFVDPVADVGGFYRLLVRPDLRGALADSLGKS